MARTTSRRAQLVQRAEERLLGRQMLDDGLDHEVGLGGGRHVGRQAQQPGRRRRLVRCHDLVLDHEAERRVEVRPAGRDALGGAADQGRRAAGQGRGNRDGRPHLPGADDRHA